MGIIFDGPMDKHKLEGIGAMSAAMLFAILSASSGLSWLTLGCPGKALFWILTKLFSGMASLGLVILNVGAAKVKTIIDGNGMDGAWDNAEKLIDAIRSTGRELTEDEIGTIDAPVIVAFRKWASFARRKPT